MEVIVKNLPDSITEKQVRKLFHPYLARLSIDSFECRKLKKGFATITIADVRKAKTFLKHHGQDGPGREYFNKVEQKIFHMNRPINCSLSNQTPDPFLLQSLEKETEKLESRKTKPVTGRPASLQRKFGITSLACGQWDYSGQNLVFQTQFCDYRSGIMIFGNRFLIIDLKPAHQSQPGHRLEIPYYNFQSFTTGTVSNPAVTVSLYAPPKLLENLTTLGDDENTLILGIRKNLSLRNSQPTFKWKRITTLSKGHEAVAPSCLCYRIMLQRPNDISLLRNLKKAPEVPESIPWNTNHIAVFNYPAQLTRLNNVLSGKTYEKVSFGVKFQFQRMAQNGWLPPATVADLFETVFRNPAKVDDATMIASVRRLANELPSPGPGTDASELSVKTLIDFLTEYQQLSGREQYYSDLAEKYQHIALIHKAIVTPAGLLLSGPEPEVINRVVRKLVYLGNFDESSLIPCIKDI